MSLTEKAQRFVTRNMSMEDALPTQMPVFVNSVAYLFGVLTLSALVMLIITGGIMVIFGPNWYHGSGTGHFFNSLHFWSTQVLFGGLILHLVTKFAMAAWRDGRWKTWIVGAITFAILIPTVLTGFLAQSNWDSQWIAVQAKDAMNSLGVGAYFNTLNLGQVLTLHIAFLPFVAIVLVILHLLLVRRDGPVKPIEDKKREQ